MVRAGELPVLFSLTQCLYFLGVEWVERRQTRVVEMTHGLFVDHASLQHVRNSFVNCCQGIAFVCFSFTHTLLQS
jgi:hypothetical protein